jgi:hypothetical protein
MYVSSCYRLVIRPLLAAAYSSALPLENALDIRLRKSRPNKEEPASVLHGDFISKAITKVQRSLMQVLPQRSLACAIRFAEAGVTLRIS